MREANIDKIAFNRLIALCFYIKNNILFQIIFLFKANKFKKKKFIKIAERWTTNMIRSYNGFSYATIDVIGIRRVLSSTVLSVITVPVSASLRKISTVMCKSEPSRRNVSWGRSSVTKITSATLTCLRLSEDIIPCYDLSLTLIPRNSHCHVTRFDYLIYFTTDWRNRYALQIFLLP